MPSKRHNRMLICPVKQFGRVAPPPGAGASPHETADHSLAPALPDGSDCVSVDGRTVGAGDTRPAAYLPLSLLRQGTSTSTSSRPSMTKPRARSSHCWTASRITSSIGTVPTSQPKLPDLACRPCPSTSCPSCWAFNPTGCGPAVSRSSRRRLSRRSPSSSSTGRSGT